MTWEKHKDQILGKVKDFEEFIKNIQKKYYNCDWHFNKKLIESNIENLEGDLSKLEDGVSELKTEVLTYFIKLETKIATLQGKAAVWGVIGGALISGFIVYYFKK